MAANAWMKGALALVALGAVVALAVWLDPGGSGDEGQDAGSAVVSGDKKSSGGGMELPEGVAREATSLAPSAVESLAGDPAAPEAVGAAGSAQLAAQPKTVLQGRVVDTNGRPVKGARIVFHADVGSRIIRLGEDLEEEPPANPETTTDSNGGFELTVAIPADRSEEDDGMPLFLRGGAQLAAAHDAFATLVADTPELTEGTTDLGTFTLQAGTRVVGRVVDESGRAIAGATVTGQHLEDERGRGGRGMMRFLSGRLVSEYNRSVTGADGRFLITGLPAGKAELTAEADGRQMAVKEGLELAVGAMQDVGDIALPAGEMIAGFVVDTDGNPVEGASINVSSMARIVVRRMEDMPRQQIGREMRLREETDKDGYFEMVGLGPGQYTVHVVADGFARTSTENVATGTRDLSVQLEPLGELIVTLKNSADDAPVRGAELAASARSDGPFGFGGGDQLEVMESEDVPGEYTVLGAGPSGTSLVVAAAGFATLEVEGPAVSNGGKERMVVLVVPESVIAGRVLDTDGKGIADARVRITEYVPPAQDLGGGRFEMRREVSRRFGGEPEKDLMQESTRTVTDETGRFELRGVPAGDWEITARAEDFVESTPRVLTVAVGQSQDDVTISLDIGGAVVGHVIGSDGEPAANVNVVVRPRQTAGGGGDSQGAGRILGLLGGGGGPDGPQRATTKADGGYEVRSLKPGVYEVELAKQRGMNLGRAMVFMDDGTGGSGNADDIQLVTVVAGEESVVDIEQPPMATLEGRVVAGGEPVEVVLVSLNEKGAFLPFGGQEVETDRFGRYVFENVEPGEYEVSTIVPGAALAEKVPVELEAGRTEEADLVFGGATLFGRVVDSESGQGARDVTIVLSPLRETGPGGLGEGEPEVAFEVVMVSSSGRGGGGSGMSMQFGGGSQSKVKTDGNGDFEVRFLKPGKYSIETLGGAYVNGESGPIEVADGESVDDVLIEVARGATLSGIVVSGETGHPLAGAPVSLSSGGSREMTMTEDGRFTFEGLDAGDYTIEVMGSGFGGAPVASQAVSLSVGEFREVNLSTEG